MDNFENTMSLDSMIIETTVGPDTVFKGNVTTKKPVKIEGVFEGEIESETVVIITESGKFTGKLSCSELQIQGYAEGTVICSEKIQFSETGVFKGDLVTKNLIIGEKGIIDGTIKMSCMRG